MKKFCCVLSVLTMFGSFQSYGDAYRYQMEREPCRTNGAYFNVCRSYDGYTTCSVSGQTLCPEHYEIDYVSIH